MSLIPTTRICCDVNFSHVVRGVEIYGPNSMLGTGVVQLDGCGGGGVGGHVQTPLSSIRNPEITNISGCPYLAGAVLIGSFFLRLDFFVEVSPWLRRNGKLCYIRFSKLKHRGMRMAIVI